MLIGISPPWTDPKICPHSRTLRKFGKNHISPHGQTPLKFGKPHESLVTRFFVIPETSRSEISGISAKASYKMGLSQN